MSQRPYVMRLCYSNQRVAVIGSPQLRWPNKNFTFPKIDNQKPYGPSRWVHVPMWNWATRKKRRQIWFIHFMTICFVIAAFLRILLHSEWPVHCVNRVNPKQTRHNVHRLLLSLVFFNDFIVDSYRVCIPYSTYKSCRLRKIKQRMEIRATRVSCNHSSIRM